MIHPSGSLTLRVALLCCLALLGPGSSYAQEPEPARLDTTVVITPQDLNEFGVYERTLKLEVPSGHRAAFFVVQIAADALLEASWPGLGEPWRVDSPLDFDGLEVLLLPPSAQGRIDFKIEARLPGGPTADPAMRRAHASRLSWRFETIPQTNAQRPWLELLGRLTVAGRAWAQGDGEGRQRALDYYGRVGAQPGPIAEGPAESEGRPPRLEAQAVYAKAVLLRLLGRHQEAREQGEQALDVWRELGDRRRLADTWNEIGLVAGPSGRTDEARQAFGRAIELAEQLGDPFRLAFLRGNLCLVDLMENRLRQGVGCYATALPAVRWIGDQETESAYLLNMAQAQRRLGELDAAGELYSTALGIQRAAGLEKLEAKTLNNLAGLHLDRGDLEAALDAFRRAALAFERLGDGRWLGRSLHNMATTYSMLGDDPSAREHLERALEVHRRLGHLSGEASALKVLGHLEARRGDLAAARRAYESSRNLERQTHDGVGEAMADAYIARTELKADRPREALVRLEASLVVLRQADWNGKSARVLVDLGRALAQLGRTVAARAALDEALEIFQKLDDPRGQGITLLHLAELTESQPTVSADAEVLDLLRRASEAFDAVTLNLNDPEFRAFFAGSQRQARERYVTRLVQADQPARAIQVSEAARAWGLRTVLAASGGLIQSDHGQLTDTLVKPTAPDLDQIRAGLDADNLLLHYLVGERASHLFVVGRTYFQAFQLPPRQVLDEAVRKARGGLGSPRSEAPDLAALTQLLLTPARQALNQPDIRRLVLALDGPLHYLPFAVLPWSSANSAAQGQGDSQLVRRFELVRIPSAAVLELERRRRSRRAAPESFAAVFADPIFAAHDLRLPRPKARTPVTGQSSELFRLRWSHREAEAVVKAAQGQLVLIAQGAEAHRDRLLGEPLDSYRFLHLATHARVDATVASRSGLELSAFDAHGSPQDGFVSLPALRRLKLRADLVVLSACRTALGPHIQGEGLVGLVQTFLEAGAGRVVASLWPVPDRSTAELMEHFYAALAQGNTPAAALRQAQLRILAKDPGRHPSAWAGFVLIGDWR